MGESGAGKSRLLLSLLALGFVMVGDDQVFLQKIGDEIWINPHPKAKDRLEIRGVGIFRAAITTSARLHLIVDLDVPASKRLPDQQSVNQLGQKIPKLDAKGVINLDQYLYLLFSGNILSLNGSHEFS